MAEEASSTNSYGKRPLWQWLLVYAVIAVVLYGAFYYFFLAKKGGYNSTNSTYTYPSPTVTKAQPPESMAATKIAVSGSEFAFTPNKITVKKGEKVEITFTNNGAYPHNMTIEGVAKSDTVQPGQSSTFTFTADKAGSYPFKCTVDSHAEKGMVGTLTVE